MKNCRCAKTGARMRAARLKRCPNLRPKFWFPFRPALRFDRPARLPKPNDQRFGPILIESIYVHRWLGQQRGIRENPIGALRRASLRRPRCEYSRQMRGFRAGSGRIANIEDSLLERDEFELADDLGNSQ